MAYRSTALAGTLFVLMTAVVPPPAAAQQGDEERTIIVTGKRLSDTERLLAECLARNCPPDEDIAATLAHAENQFIAGKYKDARHTLLKSLGRNRGEAEDHPVPVSNLFSANARVAAHLGEGEDYRSSTYGALRALKAGIEEQDHRHLMARLEIANMRAQFGEVTGALNVYEDVEDDAEEIGRYDLAGIARVRGAWLQYLADPLPATRKELERIAALEDPRQKVARLTALVLLAKLERDRGREEAAERLIREVAGAGFEKPVLLYSPPIDWAVQNPGGSGSTTRRIATDTFDDEWVDIGFWVGTDGRVKELEILRSSGDIDWSKPLLKSIAGRIYSPPAEETYRLERYSYTAFWDETTGSRIRDRSPNARIEYLDLTIETPAEKGTEKQ
ncbi:MAG: hypothetical protein ACFBQW_02525 [Sphingomonadaceae bacterium]